MTAPYWALAVTYWLHMLATVAWLGSLAALSLVIVPAARRSLDEAAFARLLQALQRRLDPLGWLSLVILLGTGMFQMSASPNYQGFFAVESRWAVAILVKHVVFLGMTAISAYLTWGLLPAIQRAALFAARGREAADAERLLAREQSLLRANLVLGLVVLLLTALARAA